MIDFLWLYRARCTLALCGFVHLLKIQWQKSAESLIIVHTKIEITNPSSALNNLEHIFGANYHKGESVIWMSQKSNTRECDTWKCQFLAYDNLYKNWCYKKMIRVILLCLIDPYQIRCRLWTQKFVEVLHCVKCHTVLCHKFPCVWNIKLIMFTLFLLITTIVIVNLFY